MASTPALENRAGQASSATECINCTVERLQRHGCGVGIGCRFAPLFKGGRGDSNLPSGKSPNPLSTGNAPVEGGQKAFVFKINRDNILPQVSGRSR